MAFTLRNIFHCSRRVELNLSSRASYHRKVGIIGAPFAKGQSQSGVIHGPREMRDAGLIKTLTDLGCTVHDYGDVDIPVIEDDPPMYNIDNPKTIGIANKLISEAVAQARRDGNIALTLGGDHSLSAGTVHGHTQVDPNLCLIWVDAHADINTPLSSPSGHFHGMPLSFLIRELSDFIPPVPGFEWLKPCINAKSIAYIGLRDLDPGELYIVKKHGICCFTMHEVDRLGINQVLERSLEVINPYGDRHIHMSFDVDSLDPRVAASTGTPIPGGLSIREGIYIAEELSKTGNLTGVDIVEVNPDLGTGKDRYLTLYSSLNIIQACFGKRREGNIPEGYDLPIPDKTLHSKT